MNKSDLSKEKILAFSLQFLRETGNADLNMRAVAKAAGTAVGSLYNYFPTKADLVIALTQQVWAVAFHGVTVAKFAPFPLFVEKLYQQVYVAQKDYHNFFITHRSLIGTGEKHRGKSAMAQYMGHLHQALLQRLAADTGINPRLWTDTFTKQQLVSFTLSNLFSALSRDEPNCTYLRDILSRLLY